MLRRLQGIAHVLSKLHQRYGTSTHPERFKVDGPPLDYGNDFTGAWDAIWETHLIPFPMDFYNNATVRTYPINLVPKFWQFADEHGTWLAGACHCFI